MPVALPSACDQDWNFGGWWSVAAALTAHAAIDDHHAHARDVPQRHALQQCLACAVLRAIEEDKIGRPSRLDQTGSQLAYARRVAGSETEDPLCGQSTQAGQQGDHAQDTERLYA